VTVAGGGKHQGRKIYAEAVGWLQRGQQVAAPAADFQHALARRDNLTVEFRQAVVIFSAEG